MDVSIIIITYNSAHCIEECIYSAIKAIDDAKQMGEICLFENGSTDGTTEKLKSLQSAYSNLNVIYSNENLGTTKSRNAAIDSSSGSSILVLDSDAFLSSEVLVGMTTFMQSNQDYGLVAPKLTYISGNFQLSYDNFPTVQRKLTRYLFLKNMERDELPNNENIDVDCLISACWLFSREVYQEVGPLDENIFYAPEDVDYCLRIWKAGYKIGYLPSFSMVHDAQELSRGIKINYFTYLHVKGLAYYFYKHRYLVSLHRVRATIALAIKSRADSL